MELFNLTANVFELWRVTVCEIAGVLSFISFCVNSSTPLSWILALETRCVPSAAPFSMEIVYGATTPDGTENCCVIVTGDPARRSNRCGPKNTTLSPVCGVVNLAARCAILDSANFVADATGASGAVRIANASSNDTVIDTNVFSKR